jgi:hypothetical protein
MTAPFDVGSQPQVAALPSPYLGALREISVKALTKNELRLYRTNALANFDRVVVEAESQAVDAGREGRWIEGRRTRERLPEDARRSSRSDHVSESAAVATIGDAWGAGARAGASRCMTSGSYTSPVFVRRRRANARRVGAILTNPKCPAHRDLVSVPMTFFAFLSMVNGAVIQLAPIGPAPGSWERLAVGGIATAGVGRPASLPG